MRKKLSRTLLFAMVVLVLVSFVSCKEEFRKIRLSMLPASQAGSKSISIPLGYSLVEDDGFDSMINSEIKYGEFVTSVTPDYVIMDISTLQFFNTEDVQSNIFNTRGDHVKVYEDYHSQFNMLHTRGLELNVPTDISNVWHHMVMSNPAAWTGQSSYTSPQGYNDYFTVNMVGVKLPDSIPEEKVKNKLIDSDNSSLKESDIEYLRSIYPDFDDYVWFNYLSLMPYNVGYTAAIVFSDTIDAPKYYFKPSTDSSISHYCIGYGTPTIHLTCPYWSCRSRPWISAA